MNDLLQKLEAAIAETERIALATESLEWIARLEHGDADVAEKDSGCLVAAFREVYPECAISLDDDVAVHIAHNDPKRVLRRVARDRKLLELHFLIHRDVGWMEDGDEKMEELPVCGHCVSKHSWFKTRAEVPMYPCATVSIVAEDYEMEVES